jgi:hypothetical protein
MAPEAMLGKSSVGKASDVFSFGVTMWELITLKKPYGSRLSSLQKNSRCKSPDSVADALIELVISKGEKPGQFWCIRSKSVSNVIKGCWEVEPTKRPDFDDVEQDLLTFLDDSTLLTDGKPSLLSRSMSFGYSSMSFRYNSSSPRPPVQPRFSRLRQASSNPLEESKQSLQLRPRLRRSPVSELSDAETGSLASYSCHEK